MDVALYWLCILFLQPQLPEKMPISKGVSSHVFCTLYTQRYYVHMLAPEKWIKFHETRQDFVSIMFKLIMCFYYLPLESCTLCNELIYVFLYILVFSPKNNGKIRGVIPIILPYGYVSFMLFMFVYRWYIAIIIMIMHYCSNLTPNKCQPHLFIWTACLLQSPTLLPFSFTVQTTVQGSWNGGIVCCTVRNCLEIWIMDCNAMRIYFRKLFVGGVWSKSDDKKLY